MPLGVGRAVARQLAGVVVAVGLSTFLIFGALYLVPGDPVTFLSGGRELSPEARALIVAQFHLDDPFGSRYLSWLGSVVHGDFGRSMVTRTEIVDVIGPRLQTTFLLLVMATVIMVAGGIGAGVWAGLGSSKVTAAVHAVTAVAIAIPPFVVASLLIGIFAVSLGWFPIFGSGSGLLDQLYHLTLPAFALAISGAAYIARITQYAVHAESRSEHVETARLRGLAPRLVVRRHILRNALLPMTTVLGLTLAGLVAGTVVIESAFGLNGLGSLLIQSVLTKDFAVVQAVALILVVIFIVVNLIVDLLALAIDPRLREPVTR